MALYMWSIYLELKEFDLFLGSVIEEERQLCEGAFAPKQLSRCELLGFRAGTAHLLPTRRLSKGHTLRWVGASRFPNRGVSSFCFFLSCAVS